MTCAALALAGAATTAALDLAAHPPGAFYDDETGQITETGQASIARGLEVFAGGFAGMFAGIGGLAFGAMKLAGLGTERRRRPERKPVRVPVEVGRQIGSYSAVSENISVGGLFVTTNQAHVMGERVKLRFKLPTADEELVVEAEVRWIRRSPVGSEQVATGMGLLFVDPPQALAGALRRFLA